jgi:hypothetical protein
MSIHTPRWASKLPIILARPRIAIDNNVISDFYIRKNSSSDLSYIFETSNVVSCCSRQVINEALHPRELPVTVRQEIWGNLRDLQDKGKLFLSGLAQMTASEQKTYYQLANLLGSSNLSPGKDANVYADAIVKSLPLYTTDHRSIDAMERALRNPKISNFLEEHELATELESIVVNSD